jgi:hypothetical protein
MVTELINRTCQVVRRSASETTDAYGNEILGESIVETVCEIQQQRTGEQDDAVAQTDWVGFFLPGESLDSGDAVLLDMSEFEVIGDPWPVRDPFTQTESHVEARLKRTAGSEDAS